MKKKYLFLCGCPRSGTTVLADLINCHPDICVGIERYYHRVLVHGELNPGLFEISRFLDYQPGDSFHSALPREQFLKSRVESTVWIGEKLPLLYKKFELLKNGFVGEDCAVIMIFRDPIAVAESYTTRALNVDDKEWSRSQDWRHAIVDWNQSVDAVLDSKGGLNIIPVSYSELFESGAENGIAIANKIFSMLGLSPLSGQSLNSARYFFRGAKQRGQVLSEAEQRKVSESCDFSRLADVAFVGPN